MDDLRVIVAIGVVIFTALSWVWSVARAAKTCAGEAMTDAAKLDVGLDAVNKRIDELREDQRDGFAGVHARLDKIVNGS